MVISCWLVYIYIYWVASWTFTVQNDNIQTAAPSMLCYFCLLRKHTGLYNKLTGYCHLFLITWLSHTQRSTGLSKAQTARTYLLFVIHDTILIYFLLFVSSSCFFCNLLHMAVSRPILLSTCHCWFVPGLFSCYAVATSQKFSRHFK